MQFGDKFRRTDNIIVKFWELEELSKTKILSESEKICEDYFTKTVKRDESGRFVVKIPFKPNLKMLGSSQEIAKRRFELLERKLIKNSELRVEYNDFMREYCELKHMSECDEESSEGFFLPHHAVLKTTSLTTKCRVVFDSSCKTDTGLSLNDVQYVGPTLQQDIFSILNRFRTHLYVMTADISKMYRQILVDTDERKYQRIFWRFSETDELKIYTLNTVTYGNASSPYLAVKCLFYLAEEVESEHPCTSKIIKRDFYMDDLLTGSNSQEEILELQKSVTSVLRSAGFSLRKWLCNDDEILKRFELDESLDVSMIHIGQGEQNKTLGIYWDSNNDLICYKINVPNMLNVECLSKRAILSIICQIFDPLGLLGPLIIRAKIVIQDLWKHKVG